MSAHSTLVTCVSGKVLQKVKVHMYESPSCLVLPAKTIIHGGILHEVKVSHVQDRL